MTSTVELKQKLGTGKLRVLSGESTPPIECTNDAVSVQVVPDSTGTWTAYITCADLNDPDIQWTADPTATSMSTAQIWYPHSPVRYVKFTAATAGCTVWPVM